MTTLTKLTAVPLEADFREPRGFMTTVHVEPSPGIHLKVMLGSAGLIVRRADAAVALPLAEIIAAAAQHCPELLGLKT